MPQFYYTTRARDIRQEQMKPMAILLSAASNLREPTKRNPSRIQVPHLPENRRGVAADPGGFIVTQKYQEKYPYKANEYMIWLDAFRPDWAGTWDLCCVDLHERIIPGKNGKKDQVKREIKAPDRATIQRRQKLTKQWASDFFILWPDTSWAWVPTCQGYTVEDYRDHARMLKPLIYQMYVYYQQMIEMADEEEEWEQATRRLAHFRVGIGSLVGRASPGFIREIVLAVQSVIGDDIPLHLWGVKLAYLKTLQQLPGVVSYDSAAFNSLFGEDHEPQKESGLSQAQYVWQEAQPAYAHKVEQTFILPQHQLLFPDLVPPQEPLDLTEAISQLYQQLSAR